jgi:leader peptidase (prepilin peptidase) / N-methyltransferase
VELTSEDQRAESGWTLARELPRGRKIAVAAVSAALTIACFIRFGISGRAVVDSIFATVVVLLTAIDLERRLIPNVIVLPATALVLLLQIALFPSRTLEFVLASVGAALFFFIPALIVPAGMGMGDVKLAALLGAALGKSVIVAILIGVVSAAVVSLVILGREGLGARRKAIPYGPFLAFGGILVMLLGGR